MSNAFVFTEGVNCAKILDVALRSYFTHHEHPLFIFCTKKDFDELSEIKHSTKIKFIIINEDTELKFKNGHEGTAHIFTEAILVAKEFGFNKICHFDSDVYFKKESLSEIINAFDEGYEIVGTRRCYGNNPGGVRGLQSYPDTISTYFMGIDLYRLQGFDVDQLSRMWQGSWHPLGWPILDFGDAITHSLLNNGAQLKFIEWNKFGSQNIGGKKTNDYELNLHMDCGSHLIHMGGVGSGYSYYHNKSNPEKSYAEWALGRYALFAKVFYNEDIGYNEPTVYGSDGRWVSGSYDENILELFKKEIQ